MTDENKESEWSEIKGGGKVFFFEKEGDALEGKLVDVRSGVGENNSTMYDLQGTHELWSVWGSTVLDGKMKRVNIGESVRIVFLGEKQSEKRKGRTYKDFQVFVKEPENEANGSKLERTLK